LTDFIGKGGRFVRGRGRVLDSRTVEVPTSASSARGGHWYWPQEIAPTDGLTDTPYWTSRDAVSTPELPRSLIVLGGGAAGVELAQAYARFGVTVTLVEAPTGWVPGEEPEASELLARVLAGEGITLHLSIRTTEGRCFASGRMDAGH
jgi:pyruvate/2-oxoglutarate dehydrogenase complex dihydrolipoamide dehydrogenase (E3) component